MATASYLIKFGADSSSVSKAITSVNSDIRSLNSQARSLDTAFKLTGDTSVLSQKLGVLKNLIGATESKSQALKTQLNNLRGSAGFDENSVKAVNLRNQIAQTEAQTTKLKAQLSTANSRGLESATQASGGLNKSIGAGTIAMGSFIGSLASKAVSAGIGLITSNLDGAISRIDTLNNSSRNFQNMGVSVGVVKEQMTALQGAIKGLPTGLDSAVSGVQLLTSSLNGDMPRSVSVFKALNDGILGFGGSSEMVTNAVTQLSQSFSNGKIDAETWNSMINSGLGPSLNAIAKTMGMTTGQLKEGLSSGKVSVDKFNDALVNLDKNGGGGIASLSQIAQDGTKGISTSMTNAKTAVTRGVADLVTSIDKGIGSLNIETPLGKIEGIGSIFTQLGTVGETAFKQLGETVQPTMQGIASAFESLSGYAKDIDFSSIFAGLKVPTLDFSGLLAPLSDVGAQISAFFVGLKFDGLTNLINQILPAITAGFQSFLGWVTPAINPLLSALSGLWNALQPVFTIIANSLVPIFQVFGSFLGGFVSGVMSSLTFAFQVVTIAIQLLTPVLSFLGQAFNAISPIVSVVAGILGTVLGTSVNVLGGIFSWFSGLAISVWSSVSSVVSSAGGVLSGIFSMIGGVIRTLAGFFTSAGSSMGSAISGASRVISGAGSAIGSTASSIIGFFSGIGGKIASGFSGVVGAITSKFSGVMESIGGMFSGAVNIGVNIVEGIKSGITGAIGGLVSAAADMAKQALNSAKKALGIHSPSRVFRDMVGAFIPAGVAVGIQSNLGVLDDANDSMKDRLLGGFQSFDMGNVSGSLGNMVSESGSAVDNSTIVNINVSADSTSNARSIANEVKLVLRQQGINAR